MIESKGHKITPIDGDLAVSRNAEIGGDADIHGKARVAGSLKVEGFLDAPNIKGVVKGLFATEEELKREYPNPRPGWCAIVLADKESGFLYLAKNREWEKQSEEAKPFDFIVDSINVFASKGELEDAKQELSEAIRLNLDDINAETNRATEAENEIKAKALKADTVHAEVVSDSVKILGKTLDGNGMINVLIPAATETKAGVVSAEDKKNFIKSITWNNDNNPSNMNNFVVAGVYDIKGEHTRVDDNLPILNTGGGHSFNARLTVLDSSITGDGKNDDKCITQVLSFSNRLGQGEVYIRTGKGSSLNNLTWEKWSTLQRNVYVDRVTSLDHLIDNGIYSGVLTTTGEMFVLVVINNYAVAGKAKSVSQFKYSIPFGGSFAKYETRVGGGNPVSFPHAWEILNKSEIDSMISAEIKKVNDRISTLIDDNDPDTLDSIKDLINWVNEHGNTVEGLLAAINANADKIDQTISYAGEEFAKQETADNFIKAAALRYDGLTTKTTPTNVEIKTTSVNLENNFTFNISSATTERAGVMSAADKAALDKATTDIKANADAIAAEVEKLKDGDTIVAQARDIHSRNGKTVTDSFLARTTAGSGTIGDGVASLKSVGGSIVKNLVDGDWSIFATNGNPEISFDKGIAKVVVSGQYQGLRRPALKFVAGHKYYISCIISNKTTGRCWVQIQNVSGYGAVATEMFSQSSQVLTATGDESVFLVITNDTSGEFYAAKPLLINLTEMFGVGNEPDKDTCDKLFGTMDALPQGLTIANPATFTSTGFNQFNPENVLDGKAIVDNAIESGDKKIAVIPCLPCKVGVGENNGYCIHGEFGDDIKVYLTPLNPKEVEGELYMHELTKDATTDTYVPLIKGYLLVEVPTTANLCAHFLWSEDKCERDTYEPYFESKVELPDIPQMSEWGLAGIQSSGTLACDEIDFGRGVYVKRIGSVDLGKTNWAYDADFGGFRNYMEGANIVESLNPWICDKYPYMGQWAYVVDKSCGYIFNTRMFIKDSSFGTDAEAFKASLQGIKAYFILIKPIEYPLPKVDNSYISSDYGVERFDSVVPCNANNLYYMRSLAGETRNFLDRMYDNTAKTDAKEVADYITSGIEGNKELATNAPNLALRALFVAAGAEYNDSGADKTKTAPWGETVTHKAGHYYLNGLGDITEEQMNAIYSANHYILTENISNIFFQSKIRTNICTKGTGWNSGHGTTSARLAFYNSSFEVAVVANPSWPSDAVYCFQAGDVATMFDFCHGLKRIVGVINVQSATNVNRMLNRCPDLLSVKIKGVKNSLDIKNSPNFNKESVLYMIQNAVPVNAITISLHADAYARLANDADIVAALEAQPLISLVSA